jgi:NAD(P)-dependent dehydrogenase (short-subunit alcohol dehydrogenase family)
MNDVKSSEPTIQQLFDLGGKAALITGGTGWLGTALARALAEAGASVVVTSRDRGRAQAAADALPRSGVAKHCGTALDYGDPASIERGVAGAIDAAGRIDILVNNGYERVPADLTNVTAEQFNRQLANATGCFLLARHVRDHAVARGGGASIIMLGSMYGIVGSYPDAYAGICMASPVAYHALKGGIISMTKHLAVYWAKDGVRVNCLTPGPFPADTVDQRLHERLSGKSPMKRMGRPWELKGALVYLASEASSYVTGHNLVVDGGWTAW